MRRCFAMRCNKTLLLLFTIIVIFSGEISANQLDVAKKYGKRFGNKNKTNSTAESKEVAKSVLTKSSESLLITEPASKLAEQVRNEPLPEMQSKNLYSFTKLENMSTTTQSPTQLTADQHPNNNQNLKSNPDVSDLSPHTGSDEHEVDVDLSQLQVSLPNVKFDCSGRQEGYYGDPDYKCEVFHYCNGDAKRDTFLCPSNSKFNQKDMTCDTESIDDLCRSEPVWGHNHMYPSTVQNNQPKYSPPLTVSSDETVIISSNNATSLNENKNNYYFGQSDPMSEIVGNEDLRKNNKNNDNKDKSKNKDNKTYAFNYFGGNFGDRHRNPTTNANEGHINDSNDRKSNSRENNKSDNNFGQQINQKDKNEKELMPVVSYNEPTFRKKQTVTQQHQFYKDNTAQNNFEKPPENQFASEINNQFVEQNKNQNKINEQIIIEQIEHYPFLSDKPHLSQEQSEPFPNQQQQRAPTTTQKPLSTPSTSKTRRPIKPTNLESYLSDVARDQKQPNGQITIQPQQQEPQTLTFDFGPYFETQPPRPPQSPIHQNESPVLVKNWVIPQNDYIPPYLQTPQTSTTESPERWPQVEQNDAFNQFPPKTIEYNDHPVRPQTHINQEFDAKPNVWTNVKEPVIEPLPHVNANPQQNSPMVQTWNSMEKYKHKPEPIDYHNTNKNREPVYQQSLNSEVTKQNLWSQEIKDEPPMPFREQNNNYQSKPQNPKWAQEIIEMVELPQYQTHQNQNAQKNKQTNNNPNFTPELNLHNTHYTVETAINYNRVPDQQSHNTQQSNRDNKFKQHSQQHQQQIIKDNRHHHRRPSFQESQQQYQGSSVSNNNGKHKEQNGMNQLNYVFHERFRPIKLSEMIPNKEDSGQLSIDQNSGQFPINLKFTPKQQQFFDEQLKQVIASKLRPNVDPKYLSLDKPSKQAGNKKLPGYVAEVLPSEEVGSVLSQKHQQKSVKQRNKDKLANNNKANKQKKTMSTANFLDELLSTDNGWTFKHFDTNLDTALSQAFPIIPISTTKSKRKHYPTINLFGQNFHQVSHPVGSIPFTSAVMPQLSAQPQPQQTIHLQMPSHQVHQQIPVHHNLQAQHSFPMQYYLPYYPMSQQLRARPFQQQKVRIWK